MTVLPSVDIATAKPCDDPPPAPAPTPPQCRPAQRYAVVPSADTATVRPCCARRTAPAATSLGPCWVPTRRRCELKTHAAPVMLLFAISSPTGRLSVSRYSDG